MQLQSPFVTETHHPLVALRGGRCGYLQIAPSQWVISYGELPDGIFAAAQDWACRLECLGAKRIYWITLSEMVPHLHIHLYPRWQETEARGLPLFEARDTEPQPVWTPEALEELSDWSKAYDVAVKV